MLEQSSEQLTEIGAAMLRAAPPVGDSSDSLRPARQA